MSELSWWLIETFCTVFQQAANGNKPLVAVEAHCRLGVEPVTLGIIALHLK